MTGGVTNEADVGLPPLNGARRAVWDYYRIEFLPDGYPGRRAEGSLVPHPIYGPYVIADYLAAHRRTGDVAYLEAAWRVARAAVARMTAREDALVFEYDPAHRISTLPNRFYSGLTQARYLDVLGRLHRVRPDPALDEAADAVLRSLAIPAERGGVSRTTPGGGTLLEEYAHDQPDYTLNGWTTATILVHAYAEATGSEAARALVAASRRGIRDVLALYDVPEYANSRYRLTGPAWVDLSATRPFRVRDGAVHVPGQGDFPIRTGKGRGKWRSRILGAAGAARKVAAELLLCRVSFPEPNSVALTLDLDEPAEMSVSIGEGPFDPLRTWLGRERQRPLQTFTLTRGVNRVWFAIPWDRAELVAYPTSWSKHLGGQWHNQYHFIHVDTLRKLHAAETDAAFAYYAERWAGYPSRWPDIPEIAGAGVALHRYGSVAPSPDAAPDVAPGPA